MNVRGLARALAAVVGLLGCIGPASPAAAGSFQVDPVNIILAADRQTSSLTIRNKDAAPVAVRVVTYRWTQENGRDVYSPTSDLIASPPIFTIAPGASQLVRVGFRTRGGRAYRVILEEIPRRQVGGAIQVALRLNLPLYVLPPGGGKPDVSWSLWQDASGNTFVEGRNAGTVHAQVLGFDSLGRDGRPTILSQEMGVILPGSARYWRIGKRPDLSVGAHASIQVRNPSGVTNAQLVVERR
jgi:fimbrial chaperone protein